eukprot:jgi/Botrbrau1/18674/Bobra.0386s0003.1
MNGLATNFRGNEHVVGTQGMSTEFLCPSTTCFKARLSVPAYDQRPPMARQVGVTGDAQVLYRNLSAPTMRDSEVMPNDEALSSFLSGEPPPIDMYGVPAGVLPKPSDTTTRRPSAGGPCGVASAPAAGQGPPTTLMQGQTKALLEHVSPSTDIPQRNANPQRLMNLGATMCPNNGQNCSPPVRGGTRTSWDAHRPSTPSPAVRAGATPPLGVAPAFSSPRPSSAFVHHHHEMANFFDILEWIRHMILTSPGARAYMVPGNRAGILMHLQSAARLMLAGARSGTSDIKPHLGCVSEGQGLWGTLIRWWECFEDRTEWRFSQVYLAEKHDYLS